MKKKNQKSGRSKKQKPVQSWSYPVIGKPRLDALAQMINDAMALQTCQIFDAISRDRANYIPDGL